MLSEYITEIWISNLSHEKYWVFNIKIFKTILLLTKFNTPSKIQTKKLSEVVYRRCSVKKVFLKASKNSLKDTCPLLLVQKQPTKVFFKNICDGVSFLIKLHMNIVGRVEGERGESWVKMYTTIAGQWTRNG